MATIITREIGTTAKGSPLTNQEVDNNFINLNTAKVEKDNAQYLDFDTAATNTAGVGKVYWNDADGTLEFGLKGGNVTLQIGQEQVVHVYNNTGSTLNDLQVVRVTGSQGQKLTVGLAQANNEVNSATSLAVVTETILNEAEGFATTTGLVRNVNTAAFPQGAALYLSPTVPGGITTTKPNAPNHLVQVGWCVRSHASSGVIFVHIQNGYELNELHDVFTSGVTGNQILKWNATTSRWENTSNLDSVVIGATDPKAASFTELTTSSTVTLNGGDATVYGITVGRGAGAVSTNTAVGASALAENTTGNLNTSVGYFSMVSNTTGNSNTALGYYALSNNTTGYANVAVGRGALIANTTGYQNIAIGSQDEISIYAALRSNTTGVANNAIGNGALQGNTTGNYNVALGHQALFTNSTGVNQTAIGYQALYTANNTSNNGGTAVGYRALFNSTGPNNVAVGQGAGQAVTTGDNSTIVGWLAGASGTGNTGSSNAFYGSGSGYVNTSGGSNSFFGTATGYSNTTGSVNVAVGTSALYANTTGSDNVAVGYAALNNSTTAGNNTALGSQSAYSNTTGVDITAVGWASLYSNTTGGSNVAVGNIAMYTNTTGGANVAVGHQAMRLNTTGNYNVSVGHEALRSNTTASNNTAVGYQAGYSNTTGLHNVYVGQKAGYSGTGSYNTFVGREAGADSTGTENTGFGQHALRYVTTGSYNTSIGTGAGALITTGSKNTIIGGYSGNQGGLDIRTASNWVVLSDGDGNLRIISDGSGYIGINAVPNGTSRLLVKGADGTVGNEYSTGLAVTGSNTDKRTLLTYDAVNDCGILASVHTGTSWRPMRVPYGTLIIGTQAFVSGGGKLQLDGGITFPATQNASSDANTLDDYEEGSWTPGITNGASYSTQVGRYVKIGNLVYVNADIVCTFTNTGAGNQKITGLPFVIENVTAMYPVGTIFPVQGFNQSTMNISTQGDVNATTVTLYTSTPSTGVNYAFVAPTTFGTTVEFEFSMVYRTAT